MIRRLLVAAALTGAVTGTAVVGLAPPAAADLACAWVDPNGVCISNPGVPRLPRIPNPL